MESNLLSMSQEFSGLPMDALITGPLNAAANANAAMAVTQTKFLLDTCFTHKDGDKDYKPIMIKMSLDRAVIDNTGDKPEVKTSTTDFNLPLLTIVPLNSLAVQKVDINFEMEVKSSFSEETNQTKESAFKGEAEISAKLGYGPFSVTVKGSASYDSKESSEQNTHYQKSNSAKYSIGVSAGQLPLPKGVLTIIDAFSKSIEPIKLEEKKPEANG